MVAAFEAAIAKAIDYSKKPPEDFVDQASLAPRAPPPAHLTHAQAQASPLPRPQPPLTRKARFSGSPTASPISSHTCGRVSK